MPSVNGSSRFVSRRVTVSSAGGADRVSPGRGERKAAIKDHIVQAASAPRAENGIFKVKNVNAYIPPITIEGMLVARGTCDAFSRRVGKRKMTETMLPKRKTRSCHIIDMIPRGALFDIP